MPIYEYRCPDCEAVNEVIVMSGDNPEPLSCEKCGAAGMERIMSAHSTPSAYDRPKGMTCCGREERCDKPPCDSGGPCCSH